MKAVYQLEWQVTPDDGSFAARNQFVGLAGSFGTVLMGRHDTPTKMSQVKDFFDDSYADLGALSVTTKSSLKGGEIRVGQTLAYVSPSFGGVTLVAALVPSEGAKIDDAGIKKQSGITDTYSVAAMYGSKKEGLYLAAGYDSYGQQSYKTHDGSTKLNVDATYTRLSAQYAVAGLTVAGMYAMTDISIANSTTNVDSTTMMLSAAYKMGDMTPKAKYGISSYDKKKDLNLEDKTTLAIGLDYALGKKTYTYVEYVTQSNATYGVDKTDLNAISVGMVHSF
jgi:predicted porin